MQFIQKATKHKGALTKYAHSHGLTTKKGTIDLQKTEAYVKRNEKGKEKTKARKTLGGTSLVSPKPSSLVLKTSSQARLSLSN